MVVRAVGSAIRVPSRFTARLLLALCLAFMANCAPTGTADQAQVSPAPADRVELVRSVQSMLAERGFDPGPIDGQEGARTNSALAAFQAARGLPSTAGVTAEAHAQLASDRAGSATAARTATTTGAASSSQSRAEQEEARRRELSRNDPRVTFRASCPGLYIPEVFRKTYRGAVPVYAMRVLNNSDRRYAARYDLVVREAQRNVLGSFGGALTSERSFTVRPGAYTEFLISEVNRGAGSRITDIEAIDVFECSAS